MKRPKVIPGCLADYLFGVLAFECFTNYIKGLKLFFAGIPVSVRPGYCYSQRMNMG